MKPTSNSPSGTTQPILCCLGQRVAGKPTQFLMERAIEAAGLDWRAITVEIAASKLAVALDGMAVMKFMALRFFPSLQAPALKLIGTPDSPWQFVGGVTSAAWHSEGWQVWHHWGLAALEWASQQVDFKRTTCWLHGDCERCRSLWIALRDREASGLALPQAVVWTDAPTHLPRGLRDLGIEPSETQVALLDGPTGTWEQLGEHWSTVDSAVIFVGDEFPSIEVTEMAGARQWLLVASNRAQETFLQKGLPQCGALSEFDQIVTCEAHDFRRWTGSPVNAALLRDAFDEYNVF